MGETAYKLIPSKGTRLRVMVILEAMVSLFALYAIFGESVSDMILVFTAWSDFTKWNVGIYAASETGVKVAESGMNR